MANAYTNAGILLKKGVTVIGEVQKVGRLKVSAPAAQSTNHSSTNLWREFLPGGMVTFQPFTAVINATAAAIGLLYDDLAASTQASYTIEFPTASSIPSWTFTASISAIGLMPGKAETPDVLRAEIEISPSGEISGIT